MLGKRGTRCRETICKQGKLANSGSTGKFGGKLEELEGKPNLLYLKSSYYGHLCVDVQHSAFIGAIVIDDLNSLEFVLTITVTNAGFFFQGVLRSLKSTML